MILTGSDDSDPIFQTRQRMKGNIMPYICNKQRFRSASELLTELESVKIKCKSANKRAESEIEKRQIAESELNKIRKQFKSVKTDAEREANAINASLKSELKTAEKKLEKGENNRKVLADKVVKQQEEIKNREAYADFHANYIATILRYVAVMRQRYNSDDSEFKAWSDEFELTGMIAAINADPDALIALNNTIMSALAKFDGWPPYFQIVQDDIDSGEFAKNLGFFTQDEWIALNT